jgi:hypothetical protein
MLAAAKRFTRDRWLFQLKDSEAGRSGADHAPRVYPAHQSAGLAFVGLLLVMLIGAVNYNLGLGYALTFFTGACAVADMVLTARNLACCASRRPRAARVRRAKARSSNCTCRIARRATATPSGSASTTTANRVTVTDVGAGSDAMVQLSAPTTERGWLHGAARTPHHPLSARPVRRLELLAAGTQSPGLSVSRTGCATAAHQRRGQRGRPRHGGPR